MPPTDLSTRHERPLSEGQIIQVDKNRFKYIRSTFYNAHMDNFTEAPAQNPDSAVRLENFLPVDTGILKRRPGTAEFDAGASGVAMYAHHLYDFNDQATPSRRLIVIGETTIDGTKEIKTTDTSGVLKNTGVFTVTSGASMPRLTASRNFAYFADEKADDRIKYTGHDTSGSGTTTWGITAPTTGLAASASGSGSLTIKSWRDYCYVYTDGTHVTGLSAFTRLSSVTDKAQVDLTSIDAAVTTEGGVTTGTTDRIILATSDGGPRNKLYKIGAVGDTTTTTFTDTNLEADLIFKDVYLELDEQGQERGVVNNNRPPATLKFPTKHRGRIFGISGQTIIFSKSLKEVTTSSGLEIAGRYEECFPPRFVIDVSDWVDDVTGLLSDGNVLYIGTKRRVYALHGDSPTNFQPPVVIHEVGVLNQNTWQLVRVAGATIGAMWVTSELRVVFSDGNSFKYIDEEVRGSFGLDTNHSTLPIGATYAHILNYDFYILTAKGGGSRRLWVYDLNRQYWFRWIPAVETITPFYWVPSDGTSQLLYSNKSTTPRLHKLSDTIATDIKSDATTQSIPTVLETPWLDLGDPTVVKQINIITILGPTDLDLDIYGATSDAELTTDTGSGNLITSGGSITPTAAGSFSNLQYSTYGLDSGTQKITHRYYKLKFSSSSADTSTVDYKVLRYLSIDFTKLGRL